MRRTILSGLLLAIAATMGCGGARKSGQNNQQQPPVISYVDLSTTAPSLQTLNGSFSQTVVTRPFPTGRPWVVISHGLAEWRIDFDIEDSLATTGTPNPISRGLAFKDQSNGKPVGVAGRVRVLPAGQ